jgi:uncharacterized membrane protein
MPAWSNRDLVLAVSVAVNLLLLGFLVGAGARLAGPGAPSSDAASFDAAFGPRRVLESLSPAERRDVRRTIVGEGLRATPLLRELRAAREDFEATARAEPFDVEATRAALERLREVERQLQDRSGELMLTILGELPPEERAQALREMRDRGRRFRGPGARDGARGGPPPREDEIPQ